MSSITPVKRLAGKLDRFPAAGLTDPERAEIMALLDALISETDGKWLATLAGYDIAEKIRFLQMCLDNILNSITDKGIDVPDVQPFRTIPELIEQIRAGLGIISGISGTFAIATSYVDLSGLTTKNSEKSR